MVNDPVHDSGVSFRGVDVERVLAELPIAKVDLEPEITSTNDRALFLAEHDENLSMPRLILAERQTAGRGRQTNTWWSSPGALTFSVLVDGQLLGLPPNLWPQVSLTAGLAVCEALEDILPGLSVTLKWPNDVYLAGKKVCGILVEAPNLRKGVLVIGVGINVNNSIEKAPKEVAALATAMCDEAGRRFALADVLIPVVDKLLERLTWIRSRQSELRALWRKRCLLTGRKVQIETPDRQLPGVCGGIDDDGALLVDTDQGVQRCVAGTVALVDD